VPEGWHGDFAACGQRSGLLALNLANIFEKLLHQKTFICLRLGNCSQHQRTVYFYLLFHVKHYTSSSDFYSEI